MQNTAVIRVIDGRLAWYPPGSSQGARWLDSEQEQASLRALLAERRQSLVFAVPGEQARLFTLAITPEEKRHFTRSLPFLLEEELAQDVDSLHFASHALGGLDYGVSVCAADAMREYAQLLAPFPGVGLWLPEPLLLPWREGEWCLVLEGGRAIARTGACAGFSVERDMLPALLAAATAAGTPGAVVIYGADQQADLGLLPPELSGVAQWRQGDLYAAMLIADAPQPALNLLQGSFARRLPLRRWWREWRVAAVLALAALGLHLVSGWFEYRQLKSENLALRTAVEETYRRAYPRGAVVDAEKQLQRQLDALSGSSTGSGFVSLLDKVGRVVADAEGSRITGINYSDKAAEMRLNLEAPDYEAVEKLRAGLAKAGLEAVMENSSAQGDAVRARLRVGERS